MKKSFYTGLVGFALGATVFLLMAAAPPTLPFTSVPIGSMPTATNVLDSAYLPIIQPRPGRTTNDNWKASVASLFAGRGSLSITNLYVTNIVINGFGLVVSDHDPVDPPFVDPTLWINISNQSEWAWDATTSTWIAINPSFNTGMYAVPSVVELRMVSDNGWLQWATAYGNLAPGDGQGRNYFWNALDMTADDGISVIKPDATDAGNPGRWNEQ